MSAVPTYAQRRLGGELRQLRAKAGLSLEGAAGAFHWSKSKLSRIETAKLPISRHDMNRLAILYGASAEELARLENWAARKPQSYTWWSEYSDVISSTYEEFITLEAQATEIHLVNSSVVPGILQVRGYAHAITTSGPFIPDPDIADALVDVRLKRQSVLTEASPVLVSATLSATALHINLGDPRLLREQLRHLLEVGDLPNVEMRIIPLDSPLGAFIGGLTLFEFEHKQEPSVVYIEYHGGMTPKESNREVRQYRRHIQHLHQNALSPDESRKLINRRLEDLR
ncbi:helix-turn-helix domain-containing protein [Embleya sp. AB8]|uniref:helix-turn-helix domain-containing protein n=1 Tax=Embleya sp. AB8 TaxID=3156304 RepID=UPI003C72584F